ncbi:MAG: transcription termination/antitermination protein NusG [bacterium]|nr:transcription termination/antitermination protein NusG [bacterium]
MRQWFILHVYSGQEHKIANLIREEVAHQEVNNQIEVIVPTKKISKLGKKGKMTVERKLYPGYIAIQMEPNDVLFKLISRTPGVLGFGGRGKNPQHMSKEEVDRMLAYIKPEESKISEIPFTKGESVKIIDGPFADFTGVIEEIYPERERIKLMVTIFGRQTPVEVGFLQVEPI